MSGSHRIRVDTGNVLAQVGRIGEAGDDLSNVLRELEAIVRGVNDAWKGPGVSVYQAASDSLLGDIRREVEELLSLPDKFRAWVRQWTDALQRAFEEATRLPD